MITLHYADNATLERMGGPIPRRTVRAILAVQDGEKIVGTAGVYAESSRAVMYAELSPEVLADKRNIVRGIRMLKSICSRQRIPVYSLADPEIQGSSTLLEHIGFKHLTGDVYQWQP